MNRLRQWFARAGRDTWSAWPLRAYARSGYRQRLAAVERHLREAIDRAASGKLRILSICAGDGRDVLGAVATHPRRSDVFAWLLEADYYSVESGIEQARLAGLKDSVRFLHADATVFASYLDIAPADILLLCGVWGHVPPDERQAVVNACRALARPEGAVIWTRGVKRGMWRFAEICDYFEPSDWELTRSTVTPDARWAIATHQLVASAAELPTAGRIFNFQTGVG